MADDQYMFQQLYVAYQETGDKIYRFAAEEIMRLRAENEKLRELVKAAYYEAYRDRDSLGDAGTDDPEDRSAWRLSAAAAAIRESE